MRFLYSLGLAALSASLVSSTTIPCTVKTTSVGLGSTACVALDSSPVDIIGGSAVTIPIPTFDTTAHPGAVLDAVYINWIDADYNPAVSFSVNADTTNFDVLVSVPATWALFSNVDGKTFSKAALNGVAGEASVDPAESDGSHGCVLNTDTYTPTSHTTACLAQGILAAPFQLQDSRFHTGTLRSTDGTKTFSPDYSQVGTYSDFVGPAPSASSGLTVSTSPAAGYKSSGAGTWTLTTSTSTALGVGHNVAGSFSVQGGSGGQVTVTVTHSLLVTVEVQYDYHIPSGGSGDPQFVGFQGQSFQVHGAPDAYFALISAPKYYINARFDYISTGSCTYNETACFTHPGTYMGLIYVGMKDANILIQAGPHATGFAGVLVNDKPMTVGDRFVLSSVSDNSYIHVISKSKLVLALDNIVVTVHNSDLFVNFDLALTDQQLLSLGAPHHVTPNGATPSQVQHHLNKWYGSFNPLHGLIGQTWRNVKYQDNKLFQGDITEYQLDKIVDHTFLYCVYEN